MRYRPIGTTGLESSVLGFGCMRLPVIGGQTNRIDEDAAAEMLHWAIDQGVNYVDTAYPYHSTSMGQPGESEPAVGRILSGGWRDRVHLATKLPTWLINSRDDMERILEHQLERLQTDHLDFYLLHGINASGWEKLRGLGALEFLDECRSDGRVRHPAFSYHGEPEDFAPIVDAYDWGFAQIQFNYIDVDYQAGLGGLRYAADKGVGVVIMEPLKGGRLANLPEPVAGVFDDSALDLTPVERALRYVWNEPGVSLLLSGMSTFDQVRANVASAELAAEPPLPAEELALYDHARTALQARVKADCTACRYCQPCPQGVDIPAVLASLNQAAMWDDPKAGAFGYSRLEGKASLCSECGLCEDQCPQGLPIRDLMAEAAGIYER